MADVRSASQGVSDSAQTETVDTLLSMLLLVLVTSGVGILVGRLIVSPLRRLASRAEMLEQGNTSVRIPERGPAELRDAARALNGAAVTLDLVERQARHLLDGSTAASEGLEAIHSIESLRNGRFVPLSLRSLSTAATFGSA